MCVAGCSLSLYAGLVYHWDLTALQLVYSDVIRVFIRTGKDPSVTFPISEHKETKKRRFPVLLFIEPANISSLQRKKNLNLKQRTTTQSKKTFLPDIAITANEAFDESNNSERHLAEAELASKHMSGVGFPILLRN